MVALGVEPVDEELDLLSFGVDRKHPRPPELVQEVDLVHAAEVQVHHLDRIQLVVGDQFPQHGIVHAPILGAPHVDVGPAGGHALGAHGAADAESSRGAGRRELLRKLPAGADAVVPCVEAAFRRRPAHGGRGSSDLAVRPRREIPPDGPQSGAGPLLCRDCRFRSALVRPRGVGAVQHDGRVLVETWLAVHDNGGARAAVLQGAVLERDAHVALVREGNDEAPVSKVRVEQQLVVELVELQSTQGPAKVRPAGGRLALRLLQKSGVGLGRHAAAVAQAVKVVENSQRDPARVARGRTVQLDARW